MRICLGAVIAALSAIASGCSADRPAPVIRTERPAIVLPEAAKRACAKPVTLPDADLTSGES